MQETVLELMIGETRPRKVSVNLSEGDFQKLCREEILLRGRRLRMGPSFTAAMLLTTILHEKEKSTERKGKR